MMPALSAAMVAHLLRDGDASLVRCCLKTQHGYQCAPAGTHAIAAALFACARPGGEIVVATGAPYDTLEEVLGSRGPPRAGSLRDRGVATRVVPLRGDGTVDVAALRAALRPGAAPGWCTCTCRCHAAETHGLQSQA